MVEILELIVYKLGMENSKLTRDTLKNMPSDALVEIILMLQNNIEQLNRNVELLTEQIKISNQRKYGRSTETAPTLFEQQELDLIFNEVEKLCDSFDKVEEPVIDEVIRSKRGRKSKMDNLKKITNKREVLIELTEEELNNKYGTGKWKKLPYEIITKLEHHPEMFEVVTYKIGVYSKNDNQTIVRAERPLDLKPGSIVTPSLMAGIMFSKYVNAMPLYRYEKSLSLNDVFISRQNMANWTISVGLKYLEPFYNEMKKELIKGSIIHADETPFDVTKDGRKAGSHSYMWVYRSNSNDSSNPVILYDYQHTRKAEHPKNFLVDYNGVLVTDGYQVYHSLEKQNPDKFKVAGCWVHLKRRFATVTKATSAKGSIAEKAALMISKIYHEDHSGAALDDKKRLEHRQNKVKPLVDEFFVWVKEVKPTVAAQSETGKGLTYAINQETFLRTFLENPLIPMDNNAAEIAIRPFTIGRKNWVLVDTPRGAKVSAIIYSLTETAKANNLKVYYYLKYLLEELPKYVNDLSYSIPEELMPWSKSLPQELFKELKK